jgi:outer membrane receptor protein involved in Fe transport
MGGWGRGNGITTSWMGGLNGAFTLVDGAMDLAGNYLYNGSVNDVIEDVKKITFNEGSRLINNQSGIGSTMTQGHRIGMRLEHKFSENTSILFEPQFHIGGGSFNESSDFETLTQYDGAADAVETNKGYTSNFGENDNWQANGFLLFRQKLGKPGRTISANIRYNFSNNLINGINQSLTSKYDDENGLWSDDVVNQRFNQKSSSASLNGRVVYTEPLGHDLFLEANYSYGWNRNFSEKFTYNSGSDKMTDGKLEYNPDGEKQDEKYSNRILNRAITQRAGLNISYQKEKFRAQLGVSANPTDTYNETTGHKPYRNTVVNWSPQAMMNYEFDDNTNIRFFYFGRSSQPSTSQLLPVPDNSDPINISLGNPNLNPYFNHNLRGMFGYTNKKTFTSVHARFGASLVENPITNARWNDKG